MAGYLIVFGVMVITYNSWSDNEWVVMGVVASFLVSGLALWVYIAQDYRGDGD